MDIIQKFLIIIIAVLTGLLVIVGYQVLLIILDLRRALKRLNSILDDAIIGGGLIRPEKLTGILEMFKIRKNTKTKKLGETSDDLN
jgi:hypothetical protein